MCTSTPPRTSTPATDRRFRNPRGCARIATRCTRFSTRYPDDTEAAIFYALALAFSADPADKTYASQLKAGGILEGLFAKQPDHPGLAHYIIHGYDVPPLAARAVGAARRYATIALLAPHALHMPSHTFTRVGSWQESIDTNIAAAVAAKREGATAEELHASDYQMYAYLQTGQDRAAEQLLKAVPEIAKRFDPKVVTAGAPPAAGFFALAAIPARYALERRAWAEAAALEPASTAFPYADAMLDVARALGAAHLRDIAKARTAIEVLAPLRDRLTQAGEIYWAGQVEISGSAPRHGWRLPRAAVTRRRPRCARRPIARMPRRKAS